MEFSRLEPWDEERADLRAGIVAHVVASVNGVKGSKPSDYMPKFGGPEVPEEMSDEELLAAIVKTNALLGGSFVKG